MLWCDACGREYDEKEGLLNCTACGNPLQRITPEEMEAVEAEWGKTGEGDPAWPETDGVPEEPALLTTATNIGSDGTMLSALLRAFGVPVMEHYPQNGIFGKILLGFSAFGVELYVPKSRLELARSLMERNAQATDKEGEA